MCPHCAWHAPARGWPSGNAACLCECACIHEHMRVPGQPWSILDPCPSVEFGGVCWELCWTKGQDPRPTRPLCSPLPPQLSTYRSGPGGRKHGCPAQFQVGHGGQVLPIHAATELSWAVFCPPPSPSHLCPHARSDGRAGAEGHTGCWLLAAGLESASQREDGAGSLRGTHVQACDHPQRNV